MDQLARASETDLEREMNRIQRDYCSQQHHPKWRAWTAKYDMSTLAWKWMGNFCIYCGARVEGEGSGAPEIRRKKRQQFFEIV